MEVEQADNIVSKRADKIIENRIKSMADNAVEKKLGNFVGIKNIDVNDEEFDLDEDDDTEGNSSGRTLFSTVNQPPRKTEQFTEEDRKKIEKKAKEAQKSQEWDIFTDVGEVYYKGETPLMLKYDICLGTITLGTKVHPYSWEALQKEFTPLHGAGKYTIKAKDPINSQIIKTQSRALAKLDGHTERTTPENSHGGNGAISLNEIARMEQARMDREEARRQADNERADSIRREMEAKNERLQMQLEKERKDSEEKTRIWTEKMIEMAKPKESGMNDFLKEFLKSPLALTVVPAIMGLKEGGKDKELETYKMIRDIQDDNRKTLESITKSFEKQIATLTETIKEVKAEKSEGGETSFDKMLATFKTLKSIEDAGREKAEEMYLLRKEFEDERNAEKEEATAGKSDSMLERLAMTAIPLFAGVISQQRNNPAQPRISQATRPQQALPRTVTPVAVTPNPQPRGAVSPTQNQTVRPRANPNTERAVRTEVSQTQKASGETSGIRTENRTLNRQPSQRGVTGISDLMNEAKKDLVLEQSLETASENSENTIETSAQVVIPELKDEANIQRIISAITPTVFEAVGLLATDISREELVKTTAEKSINAFLADGIELTSVIRDFDDETLSAILVMLPDEYHELLGELKNEIVSQIGSNGVSGQANS